MSGDFTAMVQLQLPEGRPSLAEAAGLLGIEPAELDPEFGVIGTDPERGLYAVRIAAGAVPRAEAALALREPTPAEGLFSDPPIESMDPSGG
jgi:hypothetical protein